MLWTDTFELSCRGPNGRLSLFELGGVVGNPEAVAECVAAVRHERNVRRVSHCLDLSYKPEVQTKTERSIACSVTGKTSDVWRTIRTTFDETSDVLRVVRTVARAYHASFCPTVSLVASYGDLRGTHTACPGRNGVRQQGHTQSR